MVKPIYPSQRSDDPHTSDPDIAISNEVDIRGEPLNVSSVDRRHLSNSTNHGSLHPLLGQAFQSYDGSLHCTIPIPAPRERISSLPDQEGDECISLPRQRRRSAPVIMELSGGDGIAASPATEDNNNALQGLRDIAANGQELFWFILGEEARAQEAASPGSSSALTVTHSPQQTEVLNERSRFGGRTLRQIAEAFAHSPERSRVRERANCVELESLTYNSFSDLLFGLFQEGGVTQTRVLVLFFFCADVALRALREKLTEQFQQLVDWTSRYITERLSSWVLAHGGWAAVLQESVDQVYKVAVVGVCLVGVIALTTMLWKYR